MLIGGGAGRVPGSAGVVVFGHFARATGHADTFMGRAMFRSIMLRLVLPMALASCVVAYVGLPYIERLLAEWFRSDVELRAQLVMHSMEESITDLVENGNPARLQSYLAKITADQRLLAILVCRPDGSTIYRTEHTPAAISCASQSDAKPAAARVVQLPSGSVQVSRFDFDAAQPKPFRVLMLHDLSFADRRQRTAGISRWCSSRSRRCSWRCCSCWWPGCSCAAGSRC